MKNFLLVSSLLLTLLVTPFLVKADVIPPNEHGVVACVKLDNSLNNKLSDFYIVGYYEGPMIDGHEAYIITTQDGSSDNTTACLEKGYKLNDFHLLAIRKSYLDKVGLDKIDTGNPNVYINDDVDLSQVYVPDSDPTKTITSIYSIDGISDGKLFLDKEKQTTEYSDGTVEKIETFEDINCVIDSCPHFSSFKCTSEADVDSSTPCTAIYEIGDNCLQYATCSNGGTCKTGSSEEFTKCKTCIETCKDQNLEAVELDKCATKCSSSEVINQGKTIEPTSEPTTSNEPSPSPTTTENPIQKLINTGPSFYVIVILAVLAIIIFVIYLVDNKEKHHHIK